MFKFPVTPSFGIRFALVVSIILAIIKAIIGFMSGSLVILGSALDSLMDMFNFAVNAIALKLSERTGTNTYAYGLERCKVLSLSSNELWFLHRVYSSLTMVLSIFLNIKLQPLLVLRLL